jgi:pimeloyl-ACP methyl ester carboxylesterase
MNLPATAIDLAAQTVGQGPPLIILHGLFGSQRNWGGIARALAAGNEVHGLDLRNHGDSPWSAAMGYDEMAADVARYIERHDLAPVTLLGHSMGGKAAMRLALLRPELVERLIIVDIAPVAYHNEHYSGYVEAMLALPLDRLSRRSDADSALKPVIPDESLRAFLLQNLVSDEGRFRWRVNLADIGRNMTALIGFPEGGTPFSRPTAFLAGERSNYIRPRDKERILSLFPAARLIEIPECGHWPHAEQPDRFLAAVRPLLTG